MTASYNFYTNNRHEKMPDDVINSLAKMELNSGNACDEDGYVDPDSRNMLYVSRSVDGTKWEICGKLEYTHYSLTEMNSTIPVVQIHWIVADACGQELFNRFKSLVRGHPRKIILTCSLDESELQETVMSRLNFWIKNSFRVVDTAYTTNDDGTMNVKLSMQLVLK